MHVHHAEVIGRGYDVSQSTFQARGTLMLNCSQDGGQDWGLRTMMGLDTEGNPGRSLSIQHNYHSLWEDDYHGDGRLGSLRGMHFPRTRTVVIWGSTASLTLLGAEPDIAFILVIPDVGLGSPSVLLVVRSVNIVPLVGPSREFGIIISSMVRVEVLLSLFDVNLSLKMVVVLISVEVSVWWSVVDVSSASAVVLPVDSAVVVCYEVQ